jgi:CRP/FNR family transcriptional regulator, anaerobic regulatory protein
MTELGNFIKFYCELTPEELDEVINKFSTRIVKKNKFLLKPGQVCDEFVYTVKGCFRHYLRDNQGKEITTWIVFDDMLATELSSFITRLPTQFYISALTDCEINSITRSDLYKLYQEIPAFQQFGRKIAEEVAIGAINRVISHLNDSAAVRYKNLLQKSDYIQNIPLKYLASFLGVTDTSLSRLRKRKS